DLSSVSQVMYSKAIDSLVNTIATLNLYSNVTISDISSASLNSTVQILTSRETFDLDSIAQIFNTNDVDSSSSISIPKDLESLVNILKKKDLESLIDILSIKNILSSALIRQCGSAELITEALFRRFDINEI